MLCVAMSGSTGTGVAPTPVTASQVAIYVLEGTITSSPGPMSSARKSQGESVQPIGKPDCVFRFAIGRPFGFKRFDLGAKDVPATVRERVRLLRQSRA